MKTFKHNRVLYRNEKTLEEDRERHFDLMAKEILRSIHIDFGKAKVIEATKHVERYKEDDRYDLLEVTIKIRDYEED